MRPADEPREDFDAINMSKSRKLSVASNFSDHSFYSDCVNIDEAKRGAQMEESSKGKVKGSVPLRYFLAGVHWFILIWLAIIFPVVDIFTSGSDYWMSVW